MMRSSAAATNSGALRVARPFLGRDHRFEPKRRIAKLIGERTKAIAGGRPSTNFAGWARLRYRLKTPH
jgi:hypothetical protein